MQALENAEIVALVRDRGIIHNVKPAKPLYDIAFKEMVSNPAIYNSLESDYLKTMISQITAKVTTMEDEVARYRGIENSRIFHDRLQYLANKIGGFTGMITTWEKELADLHDGEDEKH